MNRFIILKEDEMYKLEDKINDLKIKRQRCETELKILNDSIKVYESKRSTNE